VDPFHRKLAERGVNVIQMATLRGKTCCWSTPDAQVMAHKSYDALYAPGPPTAKLPANTCALAVRMMQRRMLKEEAKMLFRAGRFAWNATT
jgi:hypothetical protein